MLREICYQISIRKIFSERVEEVLISQITKNGDQNDYIKQVIFSDLWFTSYTSSFSVVFLVISSDKNSYHISPTLGQKELCSQSSPKLSFAFFNKSSWTKQHI